ncbi:MAG TPA: MarR family transcriptional regulator [Puia sp.]|jgi:DNA-binding MarR family transcriptional regulator
MKSQSSPAAAPSSRDIEVAAQLRTLLGRLVKVIRKHTRNDALLSLTERSIIGLLYHHQELLPSELAQMEKVTTQSISQVVNHLSELNFINKNSSGEDKRKVLLSLSPTGKAYLEQLRLEKQEWLAHVLHERVTPKEKETLSEALRILSKLVDE